MIYYKKKIQQDVGATAVEYGILSALIAVVTILGLQATGTNLGTTYCTVANQLSQAVGAGNTASGCSATSSSSSSSSSADSSDSSADSSSSSSSSDSSADASSSSDSSTVMTPASGTLLIPFANAVNNDLTNFAISGITTISGYYDANGNELTTPEQLANYVGVSDDLYNQLVSDFKQPTTASEQDQLDAQTAVRDAVTASGKQYYDTASDITLTGSNGYTYTYKSAVSASTPWFHTYESTGGAQINIATSKATGD